MFGFVTYLLTQVFTIFMVFIVAIFNKDLMNLFYTMNALNISTIKLCIYLAIAIYTVNVFILSIINLKLFKKGVNVE